MNLVKIYNILKIGQELLGLIVPILETMIKKDINGDGVIGKNSSGISS